MAVPTVTNIAPDEGKTFGRVAIRIDGTNFRLPPAPPADGFVGGLHLRTVRVEFGGVASPDVQVFTDSMLTARVPPYGADPNDLPADMDVVVTNLDDDGDPIGGETVTAVDGWKYVREGPTDLEDAVKWTARQVRRHLARHVVDEVAFQTHTVYDQDLGAPLNVTRLAKVPGIAITAVRLQERTSDRHLVAQYEAGTVLTWQRQEAPDVLDLEMDLSGVSDHFNESLSMGATLKALVREEPYVNVPSEPGNDASTPVRLPLVLRSDVEYRNEDRESNLSGFRATIAVEGLNVLPGYPTAHGETVDELASQAEGLG